MNREGGNKDNMRIYFLTPRLASWHNLCNPAFSREDHNKKSRGFRQTSKGFIQGSPFSCNVLSFGKDYVMLMRKVMIMVTWWWFFWWWWWRWWQWWWWRSWSGWWWWWWCIRSFWICNGCSCVTLFAAFAELQINCNNWNAISPNRASSSTWSSSM